MSVRPTTNPSPWQRLLFATLPILYGALLLGFLPWADRAIPRAPNVIGVYGIGVLIADLCTVVMLGRQFVSQRRPALLLLTCGYLFGAGAVLAYTLSFTGAIIPGRFFGSDFTAGPLFLLARMGPAALFVAAVAAESRAASTHWQPTLRQLCLAWLATVAICVVLTCVAANVDLSVTAAERFTRTSQSIACMTIGLYGLGAYMIWRRRAFNDPLYLWLALMLVTSAADLILSTTSGARFTVGWYVARGSSVVSAYLLLTFLLGDLAAEARGKDAMLVAVRYTAALAIAAAAVVLSWFLSPWLKSDLPYATLFGAVAVAVWMGGWGPALLAATAGLLGTALLSGRPQSLAVTDQLGLATVLAITVYALTCGLIIGLGEAMRKARDGYRRSRQMYKEVALELKQPATELQRADAIKSQFLATLSHELRNPLAPIGNGIAILKRLVPEGPTDIYAMMDRQLRHATRLIDDLLDVSRLDRGKLELHREKIAVDSFVNAAIETARPNIERKSHELVVRYAPRTFHVDGDPTRLAQVIANLLNNAAKFTPSNGRIELSMRTEGPQAVISVRDNGIGIPADELGRIFDLFVQLDASKTQAAAGLGLGLALARTLVTMHGGEIRAESAGPGQGSEFAVHLPLAVSPTKSNIERHNPQPASGKRRIVVVDDNVDAATSLAALLDANGHTVRTCYDGSRAFEAAAELVPDVAFIDLNMPHPDGIELAKMIRKQPWGKNVHLVALTGMGQPDDLARTRAAGFDKHLTKPADPVDLLEAAAALKYAASNIVAFRS